MYNLEEISKLCRFCCQQDWGFDMQIDPLTAHAMRHLLFQRLTTMHLKFYTVDFLRYGDGVVVAMDLMIGLFRCSRHRKDPGWLVGEHKQTLELHADTTVTDGDAFSAMEKKVGVGAKLIRLPGTLGFFELASADFFGISKSSDFGPTDIVIEALILGITLENWRQKAGTGKEQQCRGGREWLSESAKVGGEQEGR
eukprot:c19230_g1_i1 orf=142-729(-)